MVSYLIGKGATGSKEHSDEESEEEHKAHADPAAVDNNAY